MKIRFKSMINGISNKVRKTRINQKEANIKKFVNLDNVKNESVHQTLYNAREVLANYAKKENVSIGFNTTSYSKGDTLLGVIVEKKGKPSKIVAREMPIAESVYKKLYLFQLKTKKQECKNL